VNDHNVTIPELLQLLALVLGPILLACATVQFLVLRRAGVRRALAGGLIVLAATMTVALGWVLYVLTTRLLAMTTSSPSSRTLVLPVLVAGIAVTGAIAWYAAARPSR
jgi:hypothetical protein